jgi:hypothetical protein
MRAVLAAFRALFRSRLDTSLEILALRQQVAVLKRRRRQPLLKRLDRLFWIMLRSLWSRWSDVLAIVKPATVIAWHRAGFRLYWRWRSRPRRGRPKVSEEVRTLIRQTTCENSDWGAPKIHGELLKLGFKVSERTVARYLRRLRPRRGDPSQQSCRRELLDHVIPLNERHLRRLLREYVTYHNEDRLHDSLNKDAPNRRPVEHKPSPVATVTSCCRLGGLHHRYGWSVAA